MHYHFYYFLIFCSWAVLKVPYNAFASVWRRKAKEKFTFAESGISVFFRVLAPLVQKTKFSFLCTVSCFENFFDSGKFLF